MSEGLLSCPFCGEPPHVIKPLNPENPIHCRCDGCGVCTMTAELWNDRATISKTETLELPEGYKADRIGLWCEGFGYVVELNDVGDLVTDSAAYIGSWHIPALAIWLQRRVSK